MKASIKFITSQRPTKNGHGIYVELIHLKQRQRELIGHSFKQYWNSNLNEPIAQHPHYSELMPVVLECRIKFLKINSGALSFSDAAALLFDVKEVFGSFVDLCGEYCTDTTTGKLFKTVLNSFDLIYPGITVDNITPGVAENYKNKLLQKNTPNGVYTYLTKLTTLFSRVSDLSNPFKGVRPERQKTINKALSDIDVNKLINTRTIKHKLDAKNTIESVNWPRYYWLLMFYLGGIDFVDLAHLRYDKHVVNGRIIFKRNKGGTDVLVNNKIFEVAQDLLNKFDCYPYLIPAYKYASHHQYLNWCNNKLHKITTDLRLSKKPLTKSARYTFITRAQQLLIDERVTIEIVGHAQQSTHSIYTSEFPLLVRDTAHEKIITL